METLADLQKWLQNHPQVRVTSALVSTIWCVWIEMPGQQTTSGYGPSLVEALDSAIHGYEIGQRVLAALGVINNRGDKASA